MRIVTYNIFDGGVGRADPIGEVLEAQRADVIVLPEADDDYVVDRNARRLKCDVIVAPGKHHRIAVMSRHTIVHTINHALLEPDAPPCLLEAHIALPSGPVIPVIALHLHAGSKHSDEQRRVGELACVMRVTTALRENKTPHVLVGDFNSNAFAHPGDLSACKPSTRRAYEANGNALPTTIMQAVLEAGYVDTLFARHDKNAFQMNTYSTHHPGQRVDYVFGFNVAHIRDAWVERDRLATYASDHYPVGADIDA